MAGEDNLSKWDGKKKNKKNRRTGKEHQQYGGDYSTINSSGRNNKIAESQTSKHQNFSNQETLIPRKQVDPETTQYFTQIANVFEETGVDYEERSIICGNALEEAKGKELELATDYILSHTLQTLLDGCDLDHLCDFLQNCANDFPSIAMDRSGSHVAETALRSLTMHVQGDETPKVIEETFSKICEVVVLKLGDLMYNPYGSHVLRSLLCICKGVPFDFSEEFHVTKSSATLAERMNTKVAQTDADNLPHGQHGFPDLLKFLVKEMLKYGRQDIANLRVDQYSSLVLQASLKLLVGEDQELLHIIPLLLGCDEHDIKEGNLIERIAVHNVLNLFKDNAFSHLMEVILEVAPENLYDEIFTKLFKNSLFKISSDNCGSFVIQALVSSAKSQSQIDLIFDELGGKFRELLENRKSGVIAALLAACQRLHTHEKKCCQALAAAICSTTESPNCIVPRLLFLESYLWSEDKSNWKWPKGDKMNVLSCLMLQTIFRYPAEFIQSYAASILSLDADNLVEVVKFSRGERVIESFLSSGVSAKQKRKLIGKLRGHFGELSLHPVGSYTIEKCFSASNASLKETIVSELLPVRAELSKTRGGPYISRNLDIDGFAAHPEQWKSRQKSKNNVYKEFYDTFGSSKPESFEGKRPHSELSAAPAALKGVKRMKKEMDQFLASSTTPSLSSKFPGMEASMAKLGFSGHKRSHDRSDQQGSNKSAKASESDDTVKRKKKDKKKKRKAGET